MTCCVWSTCGTQFGESAGKPERCPVCEDERQYVSRGGQQWTTLAALRDTHRNRIAPEAEGLLRNRTEPGFAKCPRARAVPSLAGNLPWERHPLGDREPEGPGKSAAQ